MGEHASTSPAGDRGLTEGRLFAGTAIVATFAAVLFAWYRLFQGVDLNDESGWLVVPWRWALGDKPFVDEENLAQIPSFLVYPFIKGFAILRDYDVTGLVLYGRHLYLFMTLLVAVVTFVVLRRLVRWELALLIAALCVAFLSRDTPQVTSTTLAAALLTLGAVLGLRAVIQPSGRRWALMSGAAYGLSVIAYPTLLFMVPFLPVFLAFALGSRGVAMVARGSLARLPEPEGPPTGKRAWMTLSAWALGLALVLAPAGFLIAGFGADNLVRCWRYTLMIGRDLGQMGGALKAYEVVAGFLAFVWSRPYLLGAALACYLVYRWRPTLGRVLLCAVPLALWLAGQEPGLGTAGFILMYAALAPYFFLFVPAEHRPAGAAVLIWVWAPTLLVGAMAAYTSSLGYVHASVGVFPGALASGLFVAWALESVPATRFSRPWLSLVVLIAVLGVAVSFQFRQQAHLSPESSVRFDEGPWWGISASKDDHSFVTQLSADLSSQREEDDSLLVVYGMPGAYLLWDGEIAGNSYWIRPGEGGQMGSLPASTLAGFRRRQEVPSLLLHFVPTEGLSPVELQRGSGGLDYPTLLVQPRYSLHRKPPTATVEDVLTRLDR